MNTTRTTDTAARPPAAYRYGDSLPAASLMLEQLLKESEIHQLFESYYNLIKIPVAIIDLNANVLLSSRWQRICTQFHRVHPATCARCLECDTKMALQLNEGQTHAIYPCLNGLTDCASPIIIEGKHVANLFIGQFLTQAPDETRFHRQAEEFGFDVADYLGALREVPVIDKERIPDILDLLERMTRVITNLSIERKHAVDAQARQSLILDTIPQGVFWKDLHGAYLCCNASFARTAGLASPAEVVGKTDFDLPWPRGEADAYRADDQAVISSNQPRLHIIDPMQKPDGSRRVVDTSKVPLSDVSGTPYGIVGIYEDVTERQRTQAALVASEALARGIIESMQDAYIRADQDGRILMVSPSAVSLYGYGSMQEMLGLSAVALYATEEDRRQVVGMLKQHGNVRDRITKSRKKDGTLFWISQNVQFCHNEQGQVVGSEAFVRDISERKRVEIELIENESRYHTLVQTLQMGLVVHAPDSSILLANPKALDLLGLSLEQILGKAAADPAWCFVREDGTSLPIEEYPVNRALAGNDPPRDLILGIRRPDRKAVTWVQCDVHQDLHLDGRLRQIVVVFADITERKHAEEALRLSEERHRMMFEATTVPINITRGANITYANPSYLKTFGFTHLDELRQVPPLDLFAPECRQEVHDSIQRRAQGLPVPNTYEAECLRRDGTRFPVLMHLTTASFSDGPATIAFVLDLTERKRVEQALAESELQLNQAQKMDAIGRLAGGVAHDFNNLLSLILNYTGFVMKDVPEGDPRRSDLAQIKKAAERAAALTRQLLAFSRKQVLQPVELDLNQIVGGMEEMLQRMLGEDVDFVQMLAPDLGLTLADPGQIEQVLMNLVVNARDAMPDGGKLTIETANVELDEEHAASFVGMNPGSFVRLAVTDTGCGIDQQIQARIFEPFFTTKEKDKGTGLGLSTVFGIVRQSGGDIRVASEPGQGSKFSIYLPRELSGAVATPIPHAPAPGQATGTETVLVVEDEEDLRSVARRILVDAGYSVLSAAGGMEALRMCEQHKGKIHLVLTDVIMPGMSGKALADRLAETFPGTKVLFMSGYTDDAIAHHGVLDSGTHFLAKPFVAADLARKVRAVLDGGVTPSGTDWPAVADEARLKERPLEQAALRALPEDVRRRLFEAGLAARYDEIVEMIETLRPSEPAVATELRRMADAFDYDGIRRLLQ